METNLLRSSAAHSLLEFRRTNRLNTDFAQGNVLLHQMRCDALDSRLLLKDEGRALLADWIIRSEHWSKFGVAPVFSITGVDINW
jgi:hypothetical protein